MSGVTLLNTRPAHQAEGLSVQLKQQGYDVLDCPAMQIAPLALPDNASAQWAAFDRVFFISRNAVQVFANLTETVKGITPSATQRKTYAIGQATRQAMLNQGWPVEEMASEAVPYDSEHLLAQLPDLTGESCLIIKGEGGRDALAKGLTLKGAEVTCWSIYRRMAAPFCEKAWTAWQASSHPVLLVSSFELWQILNKAVESWLFDADKNASKMDENVAKKYQAWWVATEVIAFSERIATKLIDQGWQGKIYVVSQQSDEGVLNAMHRIAATDSIKGKG